jgi:signal transduction histidine kinase
MYEDNGIGMPDLPSEGFGIHNIESRVQTLKGHVSFESNSMGTFYNFDIPFKASI